MDKYNHKQHIYMDYLFGKIDLPDYLYIGKACLHGHSLNEKSVRYKKSHVCVKCDKERSQKQKCKKENASISGMKAYEMLHENDDLGEDIF